MLSVRNHATEAVIEHESKVPQELIISQPDPWSGAVFKLTQYVLGILACVLLMLFIPLIYQEYRFNKLAAEAYGGSIQSLIISPAAVAAAAPAAPAPAASDAKGQPQAASAPALAARPDAAPAAAPVAVMESVEHMKARQELLKAYLDAANQARDFWKGMAQMILLNLLLPVLTGLLGYVFASRAGKP